MGRIVVIGECMVEFSPNAAGDYRLGFAGDTFNTAWYLRHLMPANWAIQYFTNIGNDKLSADMLEFMLQSGIDTAHVKTNAGANAGLYVISLDKGERSFSYWRSASAARHLADDSGRLIKAISGADCVFFSGITLAILPEAGRQTLLAVLKQFRSLGVQIVFDPNYRPRLWPEQQDARDWMRQAYAVSTLVLPSYADELELFGDASLEVTAARIAQLGVSEIIIKNGDAAALVRSGNGQNFIPPQISITPVDTTGAGDSFNAGYLSKRLLGVAPEISAEFAHHIAAKVVSGYGALVQF